ncbi:M56 family metallopeptidase [Mucilaginibacter sp. UYCu711]|uniref:M56 family metallopeptidase n=1 Tax=Mucilaginibacter sp. UYCu711 TaxID=3156339 RepID=UPI003D1D46E2
MTWLYYIAEANIYLGVFYLAYCLFLTKETYYQLSRAYLLFSCVISFILPVLQIGALKPVETVVFTTVNYTLPQYTAPVDYVPTTIAQPIVTAQPLTTYDYFVYAYVIGVCVLSFILIIKLFTLIKLMRNTQRIDQGKHKLVYLPETNVAFSFFNYLFIGKDAAGANTIIRHELVHIRQKHSVDIVFLELLKVISWFNPFIYLLQSSLKSVHEYIADEQTAAFETDALTYSSFLVNNAYGAGGSSITHSFFNYNLLKKRIIMLNQQRSGNLARLKYLIALPVCAGLLCASTLAFSKTYGWVDIDPAKAVPEVLATPKNELSVTQPAAKTKPKKRNKFPIPSSTTPGYEYLNHYVMKTVTYNPTENDNGSFVVVGFDVVKNGKLTNIKIEKSGGKKYDAKALKAYTNFNMPVKDKPGHRRSVVIFYNGQPTKDSEAFGLAPDCISSWVIPGWAYKITRTGKGFEYDEYSEYLDNKFNTRVVVYDANGKYVSVSLNKATAGELALLKNKYGYTFPPLPVDHLKLPSAAPKPAFRKKDKNGAYVSEGRLNNGAVPIQTIAPKGTKALFIVDGKKYEFTPQSLAKYNSKSLLYMSCDKILVYEQGNAYAEKTWGKGYGKVAILSGNASIRIVADPFSDYKVTPVANVSNEDPAGPVTPSGYKKGYESLSHSFTSDQTFRTGLDYYQQLRRTNTTIKDAVVVVGFNVGADKKLSNVKVVKGSGSVMDNAISGAFSAFKGDVTDKPGFHTYLVHISTRGHTENEDAVVCKKNGYDNHYTIAVGSYLPVKDNDPNSSNARNPDALFRSDLDKFYKNLTSTIKYPAEELEKGKSVIVNALFSVNASHKIQYVQIIMSPSESLSNEVINALKGSASLNIFKPGSQYIVPVFFKVGNTSPQFAVTGKVVTYNPANIDIPDNQTVWTMDVVSINESAKKQ